MYACTKHPDRSENKFRYTWNLQQIKLCIYIIFQSCVLVSLVYCARNFRRSEFKRTEACRKMMTRYKNIISGLLWVRLFLYRIFEELLKQILIFHVNGFVFVPRQRFSKLFRLPSILRTKAF